MEQTVEIHAAALAVERVKRAVPLVPRNDAPSSGTPRPVQLRVHAECRARGLPRLTYRGGDELVELLIRQLAPSHAHDPRLRGQVAGEVQLEQRG